MLVTPSEPQAAGGVSRRAPLLHDGEGADCLQVKGLTRGYTRPEVIVEYNRVYWGSPGPTITSVTYSQVPAD